MKPTKAAKDDGPRSPIRASGAKHHAGHTAAAKLNTAGLESDPDDGIDQAKALSEPRHAGPTTRP